MSIDPIPTPPRRRWVRRHPFATGLCALVALFVVSAVALPGDEPRLNVLVGFIFLSLPIAAVVWLVTWLIDKVKARGDRPAGLDSEAIWPPTPSAPANTPRDLSTLWRTQQPPVESPAFHPPTAEPTTAHGTTTAIGPEPAMSELAGASPPAAAPLGGGVTPRVAPPAPEDGAAAIDPPRRPAPFGLPPELRRPGSDIPAGAGVGAVSAPPPDPPAPPPSPSPSPADGSPAPGLAELVQMTPIAFEELCVRVLLDLGYRDVARTGGAPGLGTDLIGKDRKGKPVVVHCKRFTGNEVGSPTIETFLGMKAVDHKASRGIVMATAPFSRPAIELAARRDVLLIDGDDIVKVMRLIDSR